MPLHFPAKTTTAGDGISLLEALLTTINVRNVSQRALFTLPLELGIGCRIGVKGFQMIKRQEILKTSGFNFTVADGMRDAAEKVVKAAKGVKA